MRSERQLMEQFDYDLWLCRVAGVALHYPVGEATCVPKDGDDPHLPSDRSAVPGATSMPTCISRRPPSMPACCARAPAEGLSLVIREPSDDGEPNGLIADASFNEANHTAERRLPSTLPNLAPEELWHRRPCRRLPRTWLRTRTSRRTMPATAPTMARA